MTTMGDTAARVDLAGLTVPCRLCGAEIAVPRHARRGGPFNIRPTCGACIEADRQRRDQQAADEARRAREAALAAVRADMPAALARCGVPPRWLAASFDATPDLPAGLVGRVREWARAPAGTLLLYGGPGAGKTWLAVATIGEVLAAGLHPPGAVRFIGEREYLDGLKADFARTGGGSRPVPENRARHAPLLVLDDLASTRQTDFTVDAVAGLVEGRYADDLPTIFTSNLTPDGLADAIDRRVVSRIAESRLMLEFPRRDLRADGRLSRQRALTGLRSTHERTPTNAREVDLTDSQPSRAQEPRAAGR